MIEEAHIKEVKTDPHPDKVKNELRIKTILIAGKTWNKEIKVVM
jgi:hypothetical protein